MDSSSTSTQPIGLKRPSPLGIPELLERILSHVDPYTLGSGVLLVSREWNAAGRGYLKHAEYAWPDRLGEGEDFDRLFEMLPWITRLRWMSEYDYSARDDKKKWWALLLTALEKMASNLQLSKRIYEIQLCFEMRLSGP
ncbi:hypothetical protein BGZ95_003210 [Linnemannia exigua]|uniref:F-box domain-containing protein n=1 Tax=Linnemannia exigua TaxID=604196 RepID=A0AAD4H9D7_9FUNG|nr:hypothetical protein BGZ95_003210 [Linnemannia exigua]